MAEVGVVIGCVGIGLFFLSASGLFMAMIGRSNGIRDATGSPTEAARRGEIDPGGLWFNVRYRRQLWCALAVSVPVTLLGVVLSNV